ncbi:hypothetical protein ACIQMO_08625 [Streptomyces sp. NPDC091406]|uniref:hypothetical protein n=1 Tax=unclassified Streptomyces TaxID=2593676 RepID=UPI00382ECD22
MAERLRQRQHVMRTLFARPLFLAIVVVIGLIVAAGIIGMIFYANFDVEIGK